eukprot:g6535.t1
MAAFEKVEVLLGFLEKLQSAANEQREAVLVLFRAAASVAQRLDLVLEGSEDDLEEVSAEAVEPPDEGTSSRRIVATAHQIVATRLSRSLDDFAQEAGSLLGGKYLPGTHEELRRAYGEHVLEVENGGGRFQAVARRLGALLSALEAVVGSEQELLKTGFHHRAHRAGASPGGSLTGASGKHFSSSRLQAQSEIIPSTDVVDAIEARLGEIHEGLAEVYAQLGAVEVEGAEEDEVDAGRR